MPYLISPKISSKDSKIYSFTSETKEESTSSSLVPRIFPSSERMTLSELPSKVDMEAASLMVVATATMVVAMEATSHMVTEEVTVATNHMVVAEATKVVAAKGATKLVAAEVVPRAVNPTIEPSLLATSASIARRLMLAKCSEEKDLTHAELECSKTKTESLRELPSSNSNRRKTLIEHAG